MPHIEVTVIDGSPKLPEIIELRGVPNQDSDSAYASSLETIDIADIESGDIKKKTVTETPTVANDISEQDKQSHPGDRADSEDVMFEELVEEPPNGFFRGVAIIQTSVTETYATYNIGIWRAIYVILLVLYAVYVGLAMRHRFGDEGSVRLVVATVVAAVLGLATVIWRYCEASLTSYIGEPVMNFLKTAYWRWLTICLYVALLIALVVYLVVEVAIPNPYNLVSAAGILVYVLLMFVFSHNPARVKWRPVIWGLSLQFIIALLILRTSWGFEAFKWLGDRVTEFLANSDAGAAFVFGSDTYMHHFFAFKVLSVVVFFSTAISVLYYLGVMQVVIRKVAWVMQVSMGTTAGESLNAAGNIFIGQTEAPLMIRPLLPNMTNSEIHAVMTGGFATIAGSVLAAYIIFGVPANHLLSASVMSAPAALAMAKLFYPETKKSKTTSKDIQVMETLKERNIIEAASSGASSSIKLVANIAANLIAFLALLEFVNATLKWCGHRVGLEPPLYPELTFQLICSYVLWPFAFVMGTDAVDCRKVAELIGIKTFLNEFVAYDALGKLINNRDILQSYTKQNFTEGPQYIFDVIFLPATNQTLVGGVLTPRSEVIATYALCGFANLASIGVQLGGLGAMAPSRKRDLAKVVVRAMIAGNVACFLTACIAGLLYTGESV
ncbi:solute carrier family 28 member 3 [Lingula anatina]|uniref:Sodium/nucleoside cotransporter n=1 Tax=Lingula anatina TaxID=7574 RepID=A0A1S3KGY3_LINAN|nr:solute carrier family 28 member 3 [Lingula anatina]|eukprot:XP_013421719.1 solute carrier family 28 member 3 [Lingula anatina]